MSIRTSVSDKNFDIAHYNGNVHMQFATGSNQLQPLTPVAWRRTDGSDYWPYTRDAYFKGTSTLGMRKADIHTTAPGTPITYTVRAQDAQYTPSATYTYTFAMPEYIL